MALKVNTKIGVNVPRFSVSAFRSAYDNYKKGVYRDLIAMWDRAEIDSYVSGCLMGRFSGVITDFSVSPYRDETQYVERAERTEAVIKALDTVELFEAILSARLRKYAVVDFEWDVVDGWQVPVTLNTYEQKYFCYDPKDGILKIDYGNTLKDIPSGAIVVEFKGVPAMLPVLRDYILKEFGLEAWAGFIETFGEGIIIMKYPPGSESNTALMTQLDTALETIARSSRGKMPDDVEMEFHESGRNTGDHSMFVEASNGGIAITLLGHRNAVEQSKGLQIGENLGSFKVRRELAVHDMFFIEKYMQELVRMIEAQNVNDGKYSKFVMDKSEPLNQGEHRENLRMAYEHGWPLPVSEYRKLGLDIDVSLPPVQKTDLTTFGL